MPTTVVKSIGTTGRDYSTLQSWEDASPSDLTTARSNNCTGGTTTTIILDVGASATNDFYTGHAVTNASTEQRLITAYNGTTKIATIGALNGSLATWTAPTTGQAFVIDSVVWQGQAYNDSEFTGAGFPSPLLTVSGETTDATRYIELTVAAGQSFQDQAGVRTNALKYNQSNGVGFRLTGDYGQLIDCTTPYTRMSRFQAKNNFSHGDGIRLRATTGSPQAYNLILDLKGESLNSVLQIFGGLAVNCIVFKSGSGSGSAFKVQGGARAVGCVAIRTSDQSAGGTGFETLYTNNILQSCASFGFTTCASATGWDTTNSKNNATDQASGLPGSSNQHGITFTSTSPFTNSTVASQNSIPVTGTTLSANGFLDATNAPNDITGTVRANPPTIGAWELVSVVTVLVSMWDQQTNRPVGSLAKVVGY